MKPTDSSQACKYIDAGICTYMRTCLDNVPAYMPSPHTYLPYTSSTNGQSTWRDQNRRTFQWDEVDHVCSDSTVLKEGSYLRFGGRKPWIWLRWLVQGDMRRGGWVVRACGVYYMSREYTEPAHAPHPQIFILVRLTRQVVVADI